jgi:hypothetical protein
MDDPQYHTETHVRRHTTRFLDLTPVMKVQDVWYGMHPEGGSFRAMVQKDLETLQ